MHLLRLVAISFTPAAMALVFAHHQPRTPDQRQVDRLARRDRCDGTYKEGS